MKLNWNFQRGWGGLRKNPFRGGGMDIFWNYTFCNIVSNPEYNYIAEGFNNILHSLFLP